MLVFNEAEMNLNTKEGLFWKIYYYRMYMNYLLLTSECDRL